MSSQHQKNGDNDGVPTRTTAADVDPQTKAQQQTTCNAYIASALSGDATVHFLLKNLIDMGCEPPEGFIKCVDCDGKPVSGGFGMLQETSVRDGKGTDNAAATAGTEWNENRQSQLQRPDCTKTRTQIMEQFDREASGESKLSLKPEIYLCQEHVAGPKHVNTILAHELIHAIDMCRTKMDPLHNCMQLACTEIRAENLSGECNFWWEAMRGKLDGYFGHGQKCVRRRAVDSVRANPNCTGKAELYVDAAMERCYKDTFPFERHPNQR